MTTPREYYERTWWRTNPDIAAAIAADPTLYDRLAAVAARPSVVTTAHVYRRGGAWSPDRVALHELLTARCITGSAAPDPVVYFTLGCPGVGKSSWLRRIALDHLRESTGRSGATVLDADLIRQALPEYNGGLGSNVVAPEAYDVTYQLVLPRAILDRRDLVFDTMGRATVADQVAALVVARYQVRLLLAEAPEATCRDRAARRALRDGREVPAALVTEMHTTARETFDGLCAAGAVTCTAAVDTSDENRRPRLLQIEGPWADDLRRVIDALPDAVPVAAGSA